MEGHASFVGSLYSGNIAKAKIITEEGARLIEGILVGRKYWEAPIITARICGICPVVHSLTAIEALENAFKIKVDSQSRLLRRMLEAAQIIHSHTLHIYFLSIPDFYEENDSLKFAQKYPKEAKAALRIREFATKIVEVVGGRTVHPIASEIGGFKTPPNRDQLKTLMNNFNSIIRDAEILCQFTQEIKYPKLNRQTNFVSLKNQNQYGYYLGRINISNNKLLKVEDFYQQMSEQNSPETLVKRVTLNDQSYMVGALARLNNDSDFLHRRAAKWLKKSKLKIPVYNSFYNVLAQSLEVIHFLEEIFELSNNYLSNNSEPNIFSKKKLMSGAGLAGVEAPRGTLIHYYEVKDNVIKNCNIITPTAQFLNNLEDDIKTYLPLTKKVSSIKRKNQIKTLIRAYDPCISCATH